MFLRLNTTSFYTPTAGGSVAGCPRGLASQVAGLGCGRMARGLSRELSKQKNLKNQAGNKGRTDDMTPAQRAEQCVLSWLRRGSAVGR